MMKRFSSFLCLLAALMAFAPVGARAGTQNFNKPKPSLGPGQFTRIIDDLPLMPGLEIVKDKDLLVIFGPNTIADTVAQGMVDIDSVYTFYQTTLPQLGWGAESGRVFDRDTDRLTIDAKSSNNEGITIVRFSVRPNP